MKISLLIASLLAIDVEASMSGKHHHHHHKSTLGQQAHQQETYGLNANTREFYKHRNLINEMEYLNIDMYETLNQKLTDGEFFSEAVRHDSNGENSLTQIVHPRAFAQVESNGPFDRNNNPFEQYRQGNSSESNGPFDRDNNPFEQYRTGPTIVNGTSVTSRTVKTSSSSSSTVTSSSSSSSNSNGTSSQIDSKVTTMNETTHGTYQLTEGFKAVKCASEGEQCSCLGQVHFGQKASGFQDMHKSNVSIIDTRGDEFAKGYVACEGKSFGVNSTGGHECYCLREQAPEIASEVKHCADGDGFNFCDCQGTVFLGRKNEKGSNSSLSFTQMTKYGWTSALSTGELLCDTHAFDGDPDYGYDKQCFCQADKTYQAPPPAERCAEEKGECECFGTVFFTRIEDPFGEPISFAERDKYGYSSKTVEGSIQCSRQEFGDPSNGFVSQGGRSKMQCFCEEETQPVVKRCSAQDGRCDCHNGTMFFGLFEVEGNSPASYDDVLENAFAAKFNADGVYDCNAQTFGFDPQPGKAKQCFCDDIGYEDRESIENELAYWAQFKETQTILHETEESETTSAQTFKSASEIQEETARRISEEEEKFAKETEDRLKKESDERAKIQAELDSNDKANHESDLAADSESHKAEMAAAESDNAQHQAEAAAENARKAAEQASAANKYDLQIAAQKAEAEAADKKRDAEFKQKKADAAAARKKKQQMKKELKEKNRLKQQELQAIREARKAQQRAEKQKQRLESQRLMQEYEANRAATEAARTAAAIQKSLEEAMARQMELAQRKAEKAQRKREKEAKRRQKEEERKERIAEREAERQRKIEERRERELERLRKRQEQEDARKEAYEKARKEEEDRIKQRQERALKRQRELEEQQMRALRAQAIAQSESDIKEAEELANRLAEQMEESRRERQRILDEKRELIVQKEKQQAAHEQLLEDKAKAQKELDEAKALLLKKKEMANKLKKQTTAFVQKMRDQTRRANEAARAQNAKQQKEADEARRKREEAAKKAREADEAEHQAEMKARRDLDKLQQEQHKKEMQDRKAEFEKTFKHLWGGSATGLSVVYATFEDKATADKVISAAFQDTMVAQATTNDQITYSFKNETKLHLTNTGLHVQQNDARVEMVTSDDRVPELIETAISVSGNENLDIIVVAMNNASPDYQKWVSLQATEQDQTNAYYNVDAFGGDKPIAEKRIAKMGDYQNRNNK